MKKIILSLAVLFSSSVFAAQIEWSDLEQYNEYKLSQKIVFENGLNLDSGDVYELREIEPVSIPGYPMLFYTFHKKKCMNPDETAEMSILDISGESTAVAVQLDEGCNLGIYLEVKDYYTKSAFEE